MVAVPIFRVRDDLRREEPAGLLGDLCVLGGERLWLTA
jgi:hypothetical protein